MKKRVDNYNHGVLQGGKLHEQQASPVHFLAEFTGQHKEWSCFTQEESSIITFSFYGSTQPKGAWNTTIQSQGFYIWCWELSISAVKSNTYSAAQFGTENRKPP